MRSYSLAIQHFRRALTLVGDDPSSTNISLSLPAWRTTWTNLGHSYRKRGEYQLALHSYNTALHASLAANTNTIEGADSFGPAMLGITRLRAVNAQMSGNSSVGAGSMSAGNGLQSASVTFFKSLHASMGLTYHLMQQLDSAIQHYHQALSVSPRDPLTRDLLERALFDST